MKRWLLAVLLAGLSCAHVPPYAPRPDNPCVRIILHVPPERVEEAMEHIRLTQAALGKHGMTLEISGIRELHKIHELDKDTRRALVGNDDPRFIHAYYVDHIPKNEGDGDGNLLGLQWEHGRRVIFAVSSTAQSTTFSHELGHALGLDHVEGTDPENAMCICTRNDTAGYTEEQARIMMGYKD